MAALRFVTAAPGFPIRSALRVGSLPSSVQNIECESPFTTDVITTCYLEIAQADFPALLKGWNFEARAASRSSHASTLWKPIGPEFLISEEFIVHPPEYEHGGHVLVATDATRHHVIVDLYIE